MIGGVIVVLAAGAAGAGAPEAWKALDLRLRVTLTAGKPSWPGGVGGLTWTHEPARSGLDPWGHPFVCPPIHWSGSRRDYSSGPDGVFEEGRGDDVLLLARDDPRLALFRECAPLSALTTFGLGALLLLLLQRKSLRRLSRAALPALGAIGAGAAAFAAIRALELAAPQALPPYPLPLLLATAVLGGAIGGQALSPAGGESTTGGPPTTG